MPKTRRGTFCGSPDHALNRRGFLGTVAAGAAAFAADMTVLDVLRDPVLASELKRNNKRVILLWLAGGSSQFRKTWDPSRARRPAARSRSIPTSVPGIHISELMPKMACSRMDNTCIIRSLNTKIADHGLGAPELMMHGRKDDAASCGYPDLGGGPGPRARAGAEPGARLRLVLFPDRGARHGRSGSWWFSRRAAHARFMHLIKTGMVPEGTCDDWMRSPSSTIFRAQLR